MAKENIKYIFVSGGVISGIGKGITTASISAILQSKGFKISPVKIDMYLNVDAGTIRPQEHGEVFVTDDGTESDQDLGHYERFLNTNLSKANYITTGQVYHEVLRKERAFEYDGEDVEAIPHVTDEIIRRIKEAGRSKEAEIVIVELGGTVGEYQNMLFFEASRIMELKNPGSTLHVHVAYLPVPSHLGEMKSKPVQQSVRMLNSLGIQPHIIVGRSDEPMDERRKERLATFCGVEKEYIISAPDVENIYEVPLNFEKQALSEKILNKLSLKPRKPDLLTWKKTVERAQLSQKELKIALVGKYFSTGDFTLEDSYVSVIESVKHASWARGMKPRLFWIDSEKIEREGVDRLRDMDGIVIPGGFGSRGIEGILEAIRFARENKKPLFGLCYGLQLSCVEFARNVLGLKGANTMEVDPKTPHPIIHVMSDQEKKLLNRDYGASMRLGLWKCKIKVGTRAFDAYRKGEIQERHRHRYEVNNKYREALEEKGLTISATTTDGKLVEMIEIADHPFFVGTQFHPEFLSRFLDPHPLYLAFIEASMKTEARDKTETKKENSLRRATQGARGY